MAGEYPVPGDDKWIADELRQIRAEIDELKGARAINATMMDSGEFTMKGGSFVVLDDTGAQRARLGLLSDGATYGIEVDDATGAVIVNNSLLGAASGSTGVSTTITSTTTVDVGPVVPFTVGPSGRVFVIASALLTVRSVVGQTFPGLITFLGLDGLNVIANGPLCLFSGAAPNGVDSTSFTRAVELTIPPGDHDLRLLAKAASTPIPTLVVAGQSILIIPL